MKKVLLGIVISLFLVGTCLQANASCYVEDGTFYSTSKYDMITFAIAMEQRNQKAIQMVNQGRIHSCRQASCVVLEKTREGFVKVHIVGIGIVWVYETFLYCK